MNKIIWPQQKKFAFSIYDDTDNATIANTKPVYDYLIQRGILTTKSTWVYPPRGEYGGQCLRDPEYLDWVKSLERDGIEIGLHNVGDGTFSRGEILSGLREFEKTLGYPPKVHCNHVSNTDNLYWWDRRFVFPINLLYWIAYFLKRKSLPPRGGDSKNSSCFWGDVAKANIKYVRNLTFTEINTLSRDPQMPYHDPSKPWVNYWFSSSDGHNVKLFNDLLASENLDKLETEGGACIVYTHFASGFVDQNGYLDPIFKERIDDLASRNGWFVPCGQLLDYILKNNKRKDANYWYRLSRNLIWMIERLSKAIKYRI